MENKYYCKTKILKLNKYELKENKLSLGNFIDYFDINLIPYELVNEDFDDLSYEFIQNYDNETIIEFFENYSSYIYDLDLTNLYDLSNEDLNGMLKNHYYDFVLETYKEYFQYFIINENDLFLFEKYCNYDIQHIYNKDLYILCIDHLGISWYLVNTNYSLDNLMNEYLFENTKDIYELFEKNKD